MRKILFTKNILGNDRGLFEFVGKRFEVLVTTIGGTQTHNLGKIVERTHQVNAKLYVRSQFIPTTPLDLVLEKADQMLEGGADGLVFQGLTTEDKVTELMLAFQNIAHELSAKNVTLPIVFMVDNHAGQVDLVARLKKHLAAEDFAWNIDVRTAVRFASQNITAETKFPDADLVIVDFSPFDTQEQYTLVDKVVSRNSLDVIGYMTYDIMSSDLKQAIQRGYAIPSRENAKKTVTLLYDLTLREKPAGQVIKRSDGTPLVIKAGLENIVTGVETRGGDTWYQVETVFGISGWIAGEIGGKTYVS